MGLIRKAARISAPGGVSDHGMRESQAKAVRAQAKAAKAQAELAEAETKVATEQAAAIARALQEDEAHRMRTWRRSPRKRPRPCRGTGSRPSAVPLS